MQSCQERNVPNCPFERLSSDSAGGKRTLKDRYLFGLSLQAIASHMIALSPTRDLMACSNQ